MPTGWIVKKCRLQQLARLQQFRLAFSLQLRPLLFLFLEVFSSLLEAFQLRNMGNCFKCWLYQEMCEESEKKK
jgi:hypothetical protein